MSKVIVIGAGASGIVSAIISAKHGNKVIVLERNSSPCKKILATGNGRCNFYNSNQNLDNYYSDEKDLVDKLITKESLEKILPFFKSIGIYPRVRDGLYYPYSNQAISIKNALLLEARIQNVKIICNSFVTDIEKENDKFIIKTDDNNFIADKVIISTGSFAAPTTGSDGNIFPLLKKIGHHIIKPLPALVQLIGDGNYFKDWNGIRVDAKLTLISDNKYIKNEVGEVQLTNYGISGICSMQLSTIIARELDKNKLEEVIINFLPFIDNNYELIKFIEDRYLKNRTLSENLEGLFNYKLVNIFLDKANIDKTDWYQLSEDEKESLCNAILTFKLKIIGTNSFDKAQTTSGGVSLDDVNLDTMESKIVSNLFLTGELLDIVGNCGGYNLTIAWLTGIKAGEGTND